MLIHGPHHAEGEPVDVLVQGAEVLAQTLGHLGRVGAGVRVGVRVGVAAGVGVGVG